MNYPAPTIVPITASWKPNLAFRLMNSFVDAIVGKRLTYARLIAKVPA